jgi:hypothetical protein
MIGHMFRNIKFPPIYLPNVSPDKNAGNPEAPNPILDYLGLYVAMMPFGKVSIFAIASLKWKGDMVKQLIESWANTILGVPEKFIRAT